MQQLLSHNNSMKLKLYKKIADEPPPPPSYSPHPSGQIVPYRLLSKVGTYVLWAHMST